MTTQKFIDENKPKTLKKGILLLSNVYTPTGKSRMASLLMHGKKNIQINGRDRDLLHNRFIYSDCEKDTEVIYIDDLLNFVKELPSFFGIVTDGVVVDKKCKEPFTIYPQLIISINCSLNDLYHNLAFYKSSLDRRFDIFELSACNTDYIQLTTTGMSLYNA